MREGLVQTIRSRVVLVVVYLVAAAIGRASLVDGDPMALVWPAGGLAVAWLITRRSIRDWIIDVPLLISVGVGAALLTGLGTVATTVLAISNVVAVLTVALGYRWATPVALRGEPPSSTPQAMLAFLAAAGVGSFAGVGIGALAFLVVGHDVSVVGLVVWFGRNACSLIAVGVTATLILDWFRRGRRTTTGSRRAITAAGRWPELVLLFAATAALVLVDYLTLLPVSFLLPGAAAWAGSRFASLAVSVHALAGGGGVLWLTYVDQGPFAGLGDERTNILLTQLFVAMTLVIGLFLAAAAEARAALSQELLTFARRAAHDLRNPLTAVESWTAELSTHTKEGPDRASDLPQVIAGIDRATKRMRALVDALLADATARDRGPTHVVVDLPDLVADVAAEYDAATQVRSIGVRSVTGDPVLLRQLVDNLVANALKYTGTDRPPDVTVSASRTADRVVVRVTDNGIGIPDDAREWIFEPFRRAHGDTYPGTGLGLSTCRRIVERHGGSMRALPREDGPGTVFEFDLPQARSKQHQPALIDVSA